MEIRGINSDDYIYFRVCEENNHFPFEYRVFLKKGDIIRFKVSDLRKCLWCERFEQFKDYLDFVPNPDATKYDYDPSKVYKSVTVNKDVDVTIQRRGWDILLLSEELWHKLNSLEIIHKSGLAALSVELRSPGERNHVHLKHTKLIKYDGTEHAGSDVFNPANNMELNVLPLSKLLPGHNDSETNGEKLIDCYQFGNDEILIYPLRKGEVLDFNSHAITLLFLDQAWMRMLSCMMPLTEMEQEEYFKRDFSGFIPEAERRYFRLHDDIKMRNLHSVYDSEVFKKIKNSAPTFENPFDFFEFEKRRSTLDDFDLDSEGFVRYIWCGNESLVENEIAKIADPISYEEGLSHYEHEKCMEELLKEEKDLKKKAEEYANRHKSKYNAEKNKNPSLSYIEFMVQEENKQREAKRVLVRRLTNTLNNRISTINDD